MRVGLDRSRFPGSHVTPGAPARKEVFETALDGPARTQSDVFLVFSRTGNPLVRTVFLRGQRKLTKNSSTDFTLLATIVTIVAEQLNFDAQEAQYTTKTTTPVATEAGLEKSGRLVAICDQKIFLATRSQAAVVNLATNFSTKGPVWRP